MLVGQTIFKAFQNGQEYSLTKSTVWVIHLLRGIALLHHVKGGAKIRGGGFHKPPPPPPWVELFRKCRGSIGVNLSFKYESHLSMWNNYSVLGIKKTSKWRAIRPRDYMSLIYFILENILSIQIGSPRGPFDGWIILPRFGWRCDFNVSITLLCFNLIDASFKNSRLQ